jgi:hypothetical protein
LVVFSLSAIFWRAIVGGSRMNRRNCNRRKLIGGYVDVQYTDTCV